MTCFYFRIQLPKTEAIRRFCEWNEQKPKQQLQADSVQAFDLCSQNDSNGLFVYETDGWTVFEDITQAYSFLECEEWENFCKQDSFLAAGYDDSALYAELLFIENGVVTKDFLECFDTPEEDKNKGEGIPNIESWTDVADFVDSDSFVGSSNGTLLLF